MTGAALDAHVVLARPGGFRIDAEVRAAAGEVVALMGPSGAGKSSLLTAIAGLTRITSGVISLDGHIVAAAGATVEREIFVPAARRGVVLLGQDPHLFPHLSARANVAFGLRAQGVRRDKAARAAEEWLGRVGLEGFGDRRPAELSGGQQQRVAIARAMAIDPKVLLLDEPLTSLDAQTASDIRALLNQQLTMNQMTAIVVTHDVMDAVAVATRLVLIEDGAVTQAGAVRDVLAAPATKFAATVAGVNRVEGTVVGGLWVAGGLTVPLAHQDGTKCAAVIRPADVHLTQGVAADVPGEVAADVPGEWAAEVLRLEQTLGGVRVHTTAPSIAVDITVDQAAALQLAPGSEVRLRIAPEKVRLWNLGAGYSRQ